MKVRLSAFLFVLVVAPAGLLAQAFSFSYEPARPEANDVVEVTVSGTWPNSCVPMITEVTRIGGTIRLEMTRDIERACAEVITPWSETVEVGPLDPGTYTVMALVNDMVIGFQILNVFEATEPFEIDPAVSPVEGGVTVRILGAGIGSCPDTLLCSPPVVRFGGVDATSVEVLGDSVLHVVVPAHPAGAVDVEVIAAGETTARVLEDAFLFFDPQADPGSSFEWILLPIMYDGPGAHGSDWTTTATIVNEASFAIEPWNRLPGPCPPSTSSCPAQLPAGSVRTFTAAEDSLGNWPHGYVLYVPESVADEVHVNLRVRDTSREHETWGTEIPVVRERELRTDAIVLPDIPVSNEFRRDVRVYAPQEWQGTEVAVRLRDPASGAVLWRKVGTLATLIRCITEPCFFPEPAGLQISIPADPVVLEAGVDTALLEVDPVTPGVPFWSFVTVTHNDTQQVTTVTPQ